MRFQSIVVTSENPDAPREGERCDVPDSSELKTLGSMDRPGVGRGAHSGYPAFIAALLLPL